MDCCVAMAMVLTKEMKDSNKNDHNDNVFGTPRIGKSRSSSVSRRYCKAYGKKHKGICRAPLVFYPSMHELEKDMIEEVVKDTKLQGGTLGELDDGNVVSPNDEGKNLN